MALGVIADVRVGVLAFAQMAEGRRCHWLPGGTGVMPGNSNACGQMRAKAQVRHPVDARDWEMGTLAV